MLTEAQRQSLDGKGIDWRRIHVVEADEALDALDRGKAIIVDTRRPDQYEEGYFPGAIHRRGPEALIMLPRDHALYLYCT